MNDIVLTVTLMFVVNDNKQKTKIAGKESKGIKVHIDCVLLLFYFYIWLFINSRACLLECFIL